MQGRGLDILIPDICALCGQALEEPTGEASDGTVLHERCVDEYEDNIYFREFAE